MLVRTRFTPLPDHGATRSGGFEVVVAVALSVLAGELTMVEVADEGRVEGPAPTRVVVVFSRVVGLVAGSVVLL